MGCLIIEFGDCSDNCCFHFSTELISRSFASFNLDQRFLDWQDCLCFCWIAGKIVVRSSSLSGFGGSSMAKIGSPDSIVSHGSRIVKTGEGEEKRRYLGSCVLMDD